MIVGLRHRNKYILAADSRITEGDVVVSETSNKIEHTELFVFAMTGNCVAGAKFRSLLNKLDYEENCTLAEQLTAVVCRDEEDADGPSPSVLVLQKGPIPNSISEVCEVMLNEGKESGATDLLLEERNMVSLGCGCVQFAPIWFSRTRTMNLKRKSLRTVIQILKECMFEAGLLNVYCNTNIRVEVFTIL